MSRLNSVLAAAAVAATAWGAPARAQVPAAPAGPVAHASGRATEGLGAIHGRVHDERETPVAGVTVSAVGAALVFAVTDTEGRYEFEALPPGAYLVRAHLAGVGASRRELVRVPTSARAEQPLELRRSPEPAATALPARPILAAGAGALSAPLLAADAPAEEGGDAAAAPPDHSELAWWLRHMRRSVLKEQRGPFTEPAPGELLADAMADLVPGTVMLLGRAMESSARLAAGFFADFPFSGELNLLTTGAFEGSRHAFAGDGLPVGTASISIGAPAGDLGNWAVQAAVTDGGVSSWILAGSYTRTRPSPHALDVGMAYATQEYTGGNRAALAAMSDGARNVGTVYAFDDWTLARWATLSYGARYGRYDYLERADLLSPRLGVTLTPFDRTHVRASASQRMVAPGAEEFHPPAVSGLWLPPERTFAPVAGDLRVERTRHFEIALEREIADAYLIGIRRFQQSVDDQLATLFGWQPEGGEAFDLGHYSVGTAGSVASSGWGVRVGRPFGTRMRGFVDYSLTRARWVGPAAGDRAGGDWTAFAARPAFEEFHDVTTLVETDVPETATRVYVAYRVNTAYARAAADGALPGLDARFDVQVHQGLPFLPLAASRWELLVGVRNLFREPVDGSSAYDELMVVRPPKRIVGGVLVRF